MMNASAQVQHTDQRLRLFMMMESLRTGGSERQFTLLAETFREASLDIRLGCIQRQGKFLENLGEIEEYPLGGSFLTVQSMRSVRKLARNLRQTQIEVAQSFDFYTNLLLLPAARLARVPVVVASQRQLGDLLTRSKRRAQNAAFRLADCVVCNSQAAANGLAVSGIPKSKLKVIPNGLSRAAFEDAKPAFQSGPGVMRVGMIARMNERGKNHRLFLRAAARVTKAFPPVQFLLAGDGFFRKELEELASELGIGPRTHFLGDREDISAILASLDVVVSPSNSESLSNTILEAMAAGRPVIATRVGGTPELVRDGETGLLFASDDEDGLVKALTIVLNSPTLAREWGAKARRVARADFTIERAREQFEQLYHTLLREKGLRKNSGELASDRSRSEKRLRVAIVAPSLRNIGGQSIQAALLTRCWQDDKRVAIYTINIDPVFPQWLGWVERIRGLRTIVRLPLYLGRLMAESGKSDVLHIFSASYLSFLLGPAPALLTGRLFGKKTVLNYHSGEAREHLAQWRTALPMVRRADKVVVPSVYLSKVFAEFGLSVDVIPNVVDFSVFSFRPRDRVRPHLICTRNFHPYYGIDVVLRAFARVLRVHPDASLCLVGSGEQESYLRGLVQKLRLQNLVFEGSVSQTQLGVILDRADIFVNASRVDNQPMSILEAFAAGLPVVSTQPEGMDQLVSNEVTGLLSPVDDDVALAENILRLLKEPMLAQKLSLSAYQRAASHTWRNVADLWLQAYEVRN